jgi:cytochrome c peroxidase
MRTFLIVLAGVAILALTGLALSGRSPTDEIDPADLAAFAPLPAELQSNSNPATPAKIKLGRMLYYDGRLSSDGSVSCNTCHELSRYGVDGDPTSDGVGGHRGTRNSPTVYNAAGEFVQFWDGRAANVEEQAKGPVLNPVEMAMKSPQAVEAELKSIPGYVEAFKQAFPGEANPVTFDNMAQAIGTFERGLVTPARWDAFLKGDREALTPEEKRGFSAFVANGCSLCHSGALVGGETYERLGVAKHYPDPSDKGRYDVTKKPTDEFVFKVPTLRNVAETGPYFHNGKVATLDAAVAQMCEYQLGKTLSPSEMRSIVAWLKTLTGSVPQDYIRQPQLPPSAGAQGR